MAALPPPTGDDYKEINGGGLRICTMKFASINDGDTVTVPLALTIAAFIAGEHTSGISTSVELGTPSNTGTPLTLHTGTNGVPVKVVVLAF